MYTAEQKTQIVQRIDQSSKRNLSLACRDNDITLSTYYRWKCEVQEQIIQKMNLQMTGDRLRFETTIDNLTQALTAAKAKPPKEIVDTQIIEGIIAEKPYAEIARFVGLSQSGLKKRVARLYRDHGVENRRQFAVLKARQATPGSI